MGNLLRIARNNGTVAHAIAGAGGLTLELAGDNGWVRVTHSRYGAVSARWAFLSATTEEQRDDLTVQITPDGLEHLERA
jgi:protein involved in polysaccharide export with SLBB domain